MRQRLVFNEVYGLLICLNGDLSLLAGDELPDALISEEAIHLKIRRCDGYLSLVDENKVLLSMFYREIPLIVCA